jgi:hypothetical protein
MDRYNIEILGLSEVRWPTSGSTRLECGKHIIFWKNRWDTSGRGRSYANTKGIQGSDGMEPSE